MREPHRYPAILFALAVLVTCVIYWPGLSGSWMLDDYPSIVDNADVHIKDLSLKSLHDAALSSTASSFRRPLASISFAINYYFAGLNPFWMKATNLVIHLINGLLVFLLARQLFHARAMPSSAETSGMKPGSLKEEGTWNDALTAAAIAFGWLVLPINLTGVLYVVQRMESLANVFVLLGLLGYLSARIRMLKSEKRSEQNFWFFAAAMSVVADTALGLLAKETAIMLPFYAMLAEYFVFSRTLRTNDRVESPDPRRRLDKRIAGLFFFLVALPFIIGTLWLAPRVLDPALWSARSFTLQTRLLSETRVIADYLIWTFVPPTSGLKFYYDDVEVSQGLFTPWTTLASTLALAALVLSIFFLRKRKPLVALGIALFLGAHLLTGTVLSLELVFEHRNYFASFGLLLAAGAAVSSSSLHGAFKEQSRGQVRLSGPPVIAGAAFVFWISQTALNAHAWGSQLRLAEALASRSPHSPRAQYALGLLYSTYTNYDPASPFRRLAEQQLALASALPSSSILPEQALIYMAARMQLHASNDLWDRLLRKLQQRPPTTEDQSALRTLSICAIKKVCDLPKEQMSAAFNAALSHGTVSPQLYARYGDYAYVVLQNLSLSQAMLDKAVRGDPGRIDYQIALISVLISLGKRDDARAALARLSELRIDEISQETMSRLSSRLQTLDRQQQP